jgi:SAM-dependent methyltransferase
VNIAEMAARAAEFQARIDAARGPVDFEWYRYDSLGNFLTLDRMLTGPRRDFLSLIADRPVLDIGCADGDMALFLDSLGCKVHAVDNPATNHNGMAGVRALVQAMGACVEVFERDIDDDLRAPVERYSLALMLGVLYHLKNPFRVLEALSRHARYLVLSTRVARRAPDRETSIAWLPVAYLVGDAETNDDATNFWIFSPVGLERLLARAGWRVVDSLSVGNTVDSDPSSEAGDERMFVFAENTRQPVVGGRMLHGWYEQEGWETWRWTAREFGCEFARAGPRLAVKLYVPESLVAARGSVTLSADVNGVALASQRFDDVGHYEYLASVPQVAEPVVVRLSLDGSFRAGGADERDLGLVVSEVRLFPTAL